MREFFGSNLFLVASLLIFFLMALYREWEDKRLEGELKKIFCNKKLKNGIKVSLRQPDIFVYFILHRFFSYFFGGIILRQILSQHIVFPVTVIISLHLYYKYGLKNEGLILFITFMAILWYSKETFEMRRAQNRLIIEQKKSVYLHLIEMEMKDKNSGYKIRVEYPLLIRKIIEKGEFDPKKLYSKQWHKDI